MWLVLCPLRDPALEEILLFRGELLVRLWRRHDLFLVVAEDADQQLALFTSPGTIAVSPLLAGFVASSRMSSRSPESRLFLSGPWQWKQLSERIGRMSRLYRSS